MSVEKLYAKARADLGPTEEIRLQRARMRTVLLNRQLATMARRQEPTQALLEQTCNI